MMKTLLSATLALALATPALAATQSREENLAHPQGWSAVAGMEPRAVREMARTLPLSDVATDDQPWCGRNAEIESTLRHDFDEEKVATVAAEDTTLWGSDLMGTWTVVLERPDATSCVIASGIGFRDGANPGTFLSRAGLNG